MRVNERQQRPKRAGNPAHTVVVGADVPARALTPTQAERGSGMEVRIVVV